MVLRRDLEKRDARARDSVCSPMLRLWIHKMELELWRFGLVWADSIRYEVLPSMASGR